MGMYGNYQLLTDADLQKIKKLEREKNNEDAFELVEELNEESEELLDVDKMWDALHFVLTGIGSSEPIENNPLSEAIVGQEVFDFEDFIAYTPKERVPAIIEALEGFDIEKAMEQFSMEKCKSANLYPEIWDYDDEKEEIMEEITHCFHQMKDFYKKILDLNQNVLVTIY